MSNNITIEVVNARSLKPFVNIDLNANSTLQDVKHAIRAQKSNLYPERQMLRAEQTGKPLKDEQKLSDLRTNNSNVVKLYFKDLGPQVGWTTVFLTEYAGPLVIYLIFYLRPSFIYGSKPASYHYSVHLACAAFVFHYAKRLLETIFVHRFSHTTMPILNIYKNSAYYWGFAAWIAYFINHPLYTPAYYGSTQIYIGLAGFIISELGNFSIHIALRNLRPEGSKERKIPYPTSNPFTLLFNFVSCPNYTYEVYSWIFFTIMTQTFPGLLFTIAGAAQMTIWARGKHRNYKREFEKYPRSRKAIFPFII